MGATVATVAYLGLEARAVEVQVQLSSGIPAFIIVGLPDKAVAESRERVRAALARSFICARGVKRIAGSAPEPRPPASERLGLFGGAICRAEVGVKQRQALLDGGPVAAERDSLFGIALRFELQVLAIGLARVPQRERDAFAFLHFVFVGAPACFVEHPRRHGIDAFNSVENAGFIGDERADPEVENR